MLMNFAAMAMANSAIMGSATSTAVANTTVSNATDSAQVVDEQLNVLMPGVLGSPVLSWLLRYLHIDPRTLIPILGFVSAIVFAWQYLEQYVFSQLEWFMCTVHLRPEDEIYTVISSWIASQPFAQRSKSFVVNSSSYDSRRLWDPFWWWNDDREDQDDLRERKRLTYTPAPGNHYFWYKRRLLILRRQCNREGAGYMSASEREEISISCFGRNPWVLKNLLHEAYEEYNERDQDSKTLIYRGVMKHSWGTATWQRSLARASRPFSTVILNEKVKEDLIKDIEDYLDPATRRWYSNRGIPYRRGYLLYGPPGTGKSSLSLALAGYFKMRIYIVSLSSLVAAEENLSSLFSDLPRRCIVLLEDIDTAGLTHTRDNVDDDGEASEADEKQGDSRRRRGPAERGGKLSLSGLLNILDGVASQEGRILIMTTNHVDKLDSALIRPGRVDMQIKFERADKEISASIFRAMFGQFDNELEQGSGKKRKPHPYDVLREEELDDEPEEVKQKREAELKARKDNEAARIGKLAADFAERVPEGQFSPAEIQGFLLRNKRTPEKAVEGVTKWCEDMLKEREEKEEKEAEDKKKREERRALRKEKKRKKEEKRLKEAKARAAKGIDDSSDESDSESSSGSEAEGKKRKSKKSRKERRRKNLSDSESESESSEEESARRKRSKKSKKERKRKEVSDSESGSSSKEEAKKKRKQGSKKAAREESAGAGDSKPSVVVEKAGEAKKEEAKKEAKEEAKEEAKQEVKQEAKEEEAKQEESRTEEVDVREVAAEAKTAGAKSLSPVKDLKGEADSGYGTP